MMKEFSGARGGDFYQVEKKRSYRAPPLTAKGKRVIEYKIPMLGRRNRKKSRGRLFQGGE